MKKARHWLALGIALAMIAGLGGCRKKEQPAQEEEKVETKAETGGTPKIAAVQDSYNFGKVKQGTVQEHIYKIRNEGTADLTIKRAKGS